MPTCRVTVALRRSSHGTEGSPARGRRRVSTRRSQSRAKSATVAPVAGQNEARTSEDPPVKVLLVEDEPLVARALCRGLADLGFAVEVAEDGREGRARASASTYDAFLLDRMLPDDDGVRFCADLRRSGVRVPIFIITAVPTQESQVDAFGIDADDYVIKPVDCVVLAARIRAARRKAALRKPLLRIGAITIDPDARVAYVNDGRLDLTELDYALLAILAERKGQLVTRAELEQLLWEGRKTLVGNALDVRLTRLRLGLREAVRQLVTVRGAGVRLDG